MSMRFTFILANPSIAVQSASSVSRIINLSSVSKFHFIFLALISLCTLLFPYAWFILVLPIIILITVFNLTNYMDYFYPKVKLVLPLLELLQYFNILNFLFELHSIVFYSIQKIYYCFLLSCHISIIVYAGVSRYNFYHKIVLNENLSIECNLLLGVLLFFSFSGCYLRILTILSSILVSIIRVHKPELLNPLLRVEPGDFPPGSNKSIFSFSKNTYHYHYPPGPKLNAWAKAGIITGIITAVGTMVTYELTRQQTDLQRRQTQEAIRQTAAAERQTAAAELQTAAAERQTQEAIRQTLAAERQTQEAIRQTQEAVRQTQELIRQNDLEELSRGQMTQNEYNKRYPKG